MKKVFNLSDSTYLMDDWIKRRTKSIISLLPTTIIFDTNNPFNINIRGPMEEAEISEIRNKFSYYEEFAPYTQLRDELANLFNKIDDNEIIS